MKELSVGVRKEFCGECALALRRFLGKMEGVESIDIEKGTILITFDAAKIGEDDILKITRESIEKLGYTLSHPETE